MNSPSIRLVPASYPPVKMPIPSEKEVSAWVKNKLNTKRRDKLQKQLEKKYPEAKNGGVVHFKKGV